MGVKVIPFGYGATGSMACLASLMQKPSTLLIDTRYSPNARRPEWRKGALERKYGQRYRWAGAYLGNVNYNNGGPIQIANPVRGIHQLCGYLKEGYDLVLLCWCPEYQQCHRRVVVEMLTTQMPEVEAVYPDMQAAPVDIIPALSIWQPYAFMLANPDILVSCQVPAKCIENRDWRPRYRGPLLIHASKMFDRSALPYWSRRFPGLRELPQTADGYECGGIVGRAELVDVIEQSADPWFCGRYGFVLANARPLPFTPYPGSRFLFDVPVSALPEELRRM
jgi:hypothetical protein